MTCKDCIYHKACKDWDCYNTMAERGSCEKFDDKSQYMKLPCKVGDTVWAIRKFSGVYKAKKGKVSEMYFTDGMRLCIVVKDVTRGEWGKVVFPSYEEALKVIEEGGKK